MEYLDFSSVITLIRKYINDKRTVKDRQLKIEVKIDQMHLLDQVFASFCVDADSSDFTFDNGQVCRWFNGQARISPCRTLLDSLQQLCLRHGEEVSYYKQLFQTIESIVTQIENDELTEITSDNALLAANLHANLSGMYRQSGKYEQAKQYMEQGIQLLEQFGLVPYHDSIPQITNYAVLLTEMGQPDMGLSALRKLSRVIREYNSDQSIDYASVHEAMGNICLIIGDVQQATTHFQKAMEIYETVFEFEPDVIDVKKQELLGTYAQAGLYYLSVLEQADRIKIFS